MSFVLRLTQRLRSSHARDLPSAHRGVGDAGGGTKMPVTFASPRRVILLLDKFPPRFFPKQTCSFSLPVISAPVTRCAPKKTFLVSKTLKPGFTSPCNRPAASILQRRPRPSPPFVFHTACSAALQESGGGLKSCIKGIARGKNNVDNSFCEFVTRVAGVLRRGRGVA